MRQKKQQQRVQHCMQPPWCDSMRHMSSSWEYTCTTTAKILVTRSLIHCSNDVIKFSFVMMSNTVCSHFGVKVCVIRHHFEAVTNDGCFFKNPQIWFFTIHLLVVWHLIVDTSSSQHQHCSCCFFLEHSIKIVCSIKCLMIQH